MDKPIISFEPNFARLYRRLPENIKQKFQKQIKFLSKNPKHPSLKIHKIKSHSEPGEFYVDKYYTYLFTKKENKYLLRWVGIHKTIDRI